MSPARIYVANHAGCPDFISTTAEHFELEAPAINENPEGWDTAERNILIKTADMAKIKTLFPRGQSHPNYSNLKLVGRANFTILWGGWMKFTLQYKGLAIESPGAGSPVLAIKERDTFGNTERTFSGGYANLPGFPAYSSSQPTRISELTVGYSIHFLSNVRMATPNVGAMPTPGSGAPTPPTWPYGWLVNATRVYPFGWVFKSGEGERIQGTNYWLYRWDFQWEHQYQPS